MQNANHKFKATFKEADDVVKKKQEDNKHLEKELDKELNELLALERDKSDFI